jgi:hypothetical protein
MPRYRNENSAEARAMARAKQGYRLAECPKAQRYWLQKLTELSYIVEVI